MSTGRYITRKRGCGRASNKAAAQGITLIELLVVLMIMGMMAAVAIPTFAKLGFFSGNETQLAASELYKLLSATRVYAATYRVNAALAYGVGLKVDSSTGQTLEAIDAVAMVYRMPDFVRKNTSFSDGSLIPENPSSAYYRNARSDLKDQMDKQAYLLITGEQERGPFRSLPGGSVVIADNLLPNGEGTLDPLGETVSPIRIYRVDVRSDGKTFEAELIPPLRLPEDDPALANLPSRLQYLTAIAPGQKYLEYGPDANAMANRDDGEDMRYPAHIFTPTGRIDMYLPVSRGPITTLQERYTVSVAFPPDADPRERFVNPTNPVSDTDDPLDKYRRKKIELYRGTGRVSIVPEPS